MNHQRFPFNATDVAMYKITQDDRTHDEPFVKARYKAEYLLNDGRAFQYDRTTLEPWEPSMVGRDTQYSPERSVVYIRDIQYFDQDGALVPDSWFRLP
jgi:hypothetical protein